MGSSELGVLLTTASLVAIIHTLLGPDHYVPFIAMSRAGNWSLKKTFLITVACGIGHVSSSVLLGVAGIYFGWSLSHLTGFEGFRGNIAGWLLLGFGLAYTIWGVRRALRNKPHTHTHFHPGGLAHSTEEDENHHKAHEKAKLTPWILFTIFVFGPCEPLIPLVMYPAARHSASGVAAVSLVFFVCTLATMTLLVTLGYFGVSRIPLGKLERYSHALAGGAIICCGAAIQMGL